MLIAALLLMLQRARSARTRERAAQLAYPITAYAMHVAHYHAERNHQELSNRLLLGCSAVAECPGGRVKRRQRLGGMLNFYYRAAV